MKKEFIFFCVFGVCPPGRYAGYTSNSFIASLFNVNACLALGYIYGYSIPLWMPGRRGLLKPMQPALPVHSI